MLNYPWFIIFLSNYFQGSSFSTSGVSDAHAAARGSDDGASSLHAKSASATFPYTYPSEKTLQLVSLGLTGFLYGRIMRTWIAGSAPFVGPIFVLHAAFTCRTLTPGAFQNPAQHVACCF